MAKRDGPGSNTSGDTPTRDPWRSRIVGHESVAPAELQPHGMNARRHPANQAAALDGVLSEIGWLQSTTCSQGCRQKAYRRRATAS